MKHVCGVFVFFLFVYYTAALKHKYKEDDAASYTTSTTLQMKLNFTFTTNNNKEDYIIQWTAEYYASNLAESVVVALICDGIEFNKIDTHPNPDGPDELGWEVGSGWKYVDLNAGSHTFTIEYASTTAGQQVGIRRVRVMATPANVDMV